MTVNQIAFFGLFFLSVILYYCMPKKCQWMALLGISLVFYHLMGVDNFVYVLTTTVTIWGGTLLMYRIDAATEEELKNADPKPSRQEKKEKKAKAKAKKRIWLLGIIFINLGMLLVLKYGNFFISNINGILKLFGMDGLNKLGLLAPLGISYYTLQSIGYALEVYKGKSVPEKNPLKVLLFVTYYPQMTQGPIGRYPDMAPQLFSGHSFSYKNLSYGCQRILWGLVKKAVIADNLKPLVRGIFSSYDTAGGFTLFMGCVYMVFQTYADFSGYTDIVLGISEVYGIDLINNFERPLFAKSLAEYWRRWHISLSSWFRDYIFYPASISKPAVKFGKLGQKISPRVKKIFPVVYAMSIVWVCTGLWHDASWRYILWGASNGVVMIAALLLEPQFNFLKKKLHIKEDAWWWKLFSMVRTFLIVVLLKVFPGAGSTRESLIIIKRMVTTFRPSLTYDAFFPGWAGCRVVYVTLGLLVFLLVSIIQEKKGSVRDILAKKSPVLRWIVYFVLIAMYLSMGVFDSTAVGGFEYAQF